MALKHINECFVCGQGNPQGLQVNFMIKDGEIRGEFIPNENHRGARDLLHGGLICALLDEAMAALINGVLGTDAATASIEVRFKKPARINEKLFIKAQLIGSNRRIKYSLATIEREDGVVVATGKGKFIHRFK